MFGASICFGRPSLLPGKLNSADRSYILATLLKRMYYVLRLHSYRYSLGLVAFLQYNSPHQESYLSSEWMASLVERVINGKRQNIALILNRNMNWQVAVVLLVGSGIFFPLAACMHAAYFLSLASCNISLK